MFKLSVLSLSFASLLSLTSAAPIPRDVGVLTCDVVASGNLLLVSNRHTPPGVAPVTHNPAFTGVRDGDGEQILLTKEGGQPASPETFDFLKCESNKGKGGFMGYKNTNETVYGHLSPRSAPRHCLTASSVVSSSVRFTSSPCSLSDDSSQFFQYFSLSDGQYLEFKGHQESSDANPPYDFVIEVADSKNGKVVLDAERPSVSPYAGYSFRLVN